MIRKRILAALLVCLAAAPAGRAAAQAPETEYEGAAALGLALRRLGTGTRVLMIGAHPDDESTQILGTLALGRGADVAYLSLTRGEGGQNGIGAELQEGLGILRTEELLAARRLDGARQFFTRAYDFGFSKNADEALRHWPRDSVLADVVAVVRAYRPDVILSVFTGTPRDGHGQHQVAGMMAHEAFTAAADPARFPEQAARGLAPHAVSRLYLSLWRDAVEGDAVVLATGEIDPLLGRSYFQTAMASRSRHRSQDMGSLLAPGPQRSRLRLVESRVGGGGGLFAGVDTTLALRARSGPAEAARLLDEYGARVVALRERYNPLRPGDLAAGLAEALRLLAEAEGVLRGAAPSSPLAADVAVERAQAEEALLLASAVRLDAVADREAVVPGESLEVEVSLWNGGRASVRVSALEPRLPHGWTAEPLGEAPAEAAPGTLVARRFRVTLPADAAPSEPYYLRQPRRGDLYAWPAGAEEAGAPFGPAPLRAAARLEVHGAAATAEEEVTHRFVDKMQGELRRPVRVVPAVSVLLEPGVAIVPLGEGGGGPLRFAVRLRAAGEAPVSGTLRLRLPEGWRAEPEAATVDFAGARDQAVEVGVWPGASLAAGAHPVAAVFDASDGRRYTRGYELVDYPHTRPRPLYHPARASVTALDLRLPPGLRVGYVLGAGDEVLDALRQLGLAVDALGPADLASADLSRYDVIVTGIRAYEVRPDLLAHNRRLLDYVRAGGTMVVQYNKYEFTEPGIAPYPLTMRRPHDRVTDEAADVRLLLPDHPALSWPNRITAADFEGWVQERGLYFPHTWDERYTPLLEMADPGEAPQRGALLVARYGAGTYAYTGLAFFRQLPEGVPGAYRLFANLLALGADR